MWPGYVLATVAAVSWAAGGVAAKWLFSAPSEATAEWPISPLGVSVDPMHLSASRALLAAVLLVAYVALFRRAELRLPARDIPFSVLFGIVGLGLLHYFYYEAIARSNVATGILLEYLAPVIVLVVSVTFLGERLSAALPVAVVLSVCGCALMVGLGEGALAISGAALAYGLLAAFTFAFYMLAGRYSSDRLSSWTLLAWGMVVAAIFWMVVLGGPLEVLGVFEDVRTFLAVAFVALVSTVVPFGLFLRALAYIEATRAAVTATLEPVVAGVFAWILLGEHLSTLQMLGGGLVVVAVAVAQLRGPAEEELPPGG